MKAARCEGMRACRDLTRAAQWPGPRSRKLAGTPRQGQGRSGPPGTLRRTRPRMLSPALMAAVFAFAAPPVSEPRARAPASEGRTRSQPADAAQPSASAAGSPEDREIEVKTQREDGLDGQRRAEAETPGFVTVIELDHEAGARPSDGLAELLSRAPAANVRSLGGLGQFASVSLRGSSAQQVGIFYEGVPLGDAESGLADLGDLPLDNLESVAIY